MSEEIKFKTPELNSVVEDSAKAEDMAYAGKQGRDTAAGERALAMKFGYQDNGMYGPRKDASAEWHDNQADAQENKAAYDYEIRNANETYFSYVNSLPTMLGALGIEPGSAAYSQLFNEIDQNIIEGKYNNRKVEDFKNERGYLPSYLEQGAKLDISRSSSKEE